MCKSPVEEWAFRVVVIIRNKCVQCVILPGKSDKKKKEKKEPYSCSEMTKSCLEKVLFQGPLHQLVVQAGTSDLLKLLNGLVVHAQLGSECGDLE